MDKILQQQTLLRQSYEHDFEFGEQYGRTDAYFEELDDVESRTRKPINYSLKILPKRRGITDRTTSSLSRTTDSISLPSSRQCSQALSSSPPQPLTSNEEERLLRCSAEDAHEPPVTVLSYLQDWLEEDESSPYPSHEDDITTLHSDIDSSEILYSSSSSPPPDYVPVKRSISSTLWSDSPSSCASDTSRLKNPAQRLRARFSGPHSRLSPSEEYKRSSRWICTFCQKQSTGQWEWERHESTHAPPAIKWICMPDGLAVEDDKCLFCGQDSPDDAHLEGHHVRECLQSPLDDRTFTRKDHLKSHMARVHKSEAYGVRSLMWQCSDEIHSVLQDWSRRSEPWEYEDSMIWCGFCCTSLPDWTSRLEHVGSHLKKGQHMSAWQSYHTDIFDIEQYDGDPGGFAAFVDDDESFQSNSTRDAHRNGMVLLPYGQNPLKGLHQPNARPGSHYTEGLYGRSHRSSSVATNIRLYAEDTETKRSARYIPDSGRRVFSS